MSKSLETIFSKPIPAAPKHLQRTLLRLQRHNFHVTYQRGSEMHIADGLSGVHLEGQPTVCAIQFQDVEATDEISVSPERLQAIKAATASDTVLQNLSGL